MRIEVNTSACICAGICVEDAPTVFTINEEKFVVELLQPEVGQELEEVVRLAAGHCPAQVISFS